MAQQQENMVHDTEYYFLAAQNGKKWAAADKAVDESFFGPDMPDPSPFNTDLLLIGIDSWLVGLGIFAMSCIGAFAFASATQSWFTA